MLPLEIGGTLIREWERIHVDYGREHLAPGTNIIIGKMDDALDIDHPWLGGEDSLARPPLLGSLQNTLGPNGTAANTRHSISVMGIVLGPGRESR